MPKSNTDAVTVQLWAERLNSGKYSTSRDALIAVSQTAGKNKWTDAEKAEAVKAVELYFHGAMDKVPAKKTAPKKPSKKAAPKSAAKKIKDTAAPVTDGKADKDYVAVTSTLPPGVLPHMQGPALLHLATTMVDRLTPEQNKRLTQHAFNLIEVEVAVLVRQLGGDVEKSRR